jgi:hypothetical protein
MSSYEYNRLSGNIAVLREVAREYPCKTIENVIQQMEARIKEVAHG